MKRLTQKNIVAYLLDRNFLTTEPLMNGDFKLMNIQSRNWIFMIELGQNKGLFVKQLVKVNPSDIYLMQKDAIVYHLIHRQHFYKELQPYVPEYYGYDPSIQVIVLKYYRNAINLRPFSYKKEQKTLSFSKKLAEIFFYLHKPIQNDIPDQPSLQFFNKKIPWILRLNKNISSPESLVLQMILQDANLLNGLKQAKENWESTVLIHGDVKLVNILVIQDKKTTNIKLIDWEMANIGDPLWDIAGLIQSYLAFIVQNKKSTTEKLLVLDKQFFHSFETCRKCIQTFWTSYAFQQQWTKTERQQKLIKTIYYTGARLLQTTYETNKKFTENLQPTTKQLLQLTQHIFKSPHHTIGILGL